jgi:AAHS family 4-hydroxybenzoate transporter-like MFS transporter
MSSEPRTVDVALLIDQRPLGRFNYRVIVLSWLITAFDGLDQLMIGFTAPYMRDELHLTNTMIGYLVSAGLAGMTIGGFLFTYVADRIGRRPTIIATAFAFGILTAATAAASSYHALLFMRFVNGLPIGGLIPLAWALNIEFVPRRIRSTVVTIIMVGYSFGGSVVGPLTNLLAPQYGWQGVYLIAGIGTLCCAGALWLGLPESIRFLVIKGRRPDLVVRTLKRIDASCDVTPTDRFVLSDEIRTDPGFRVGHYFRGNLRLITPLLWLGYLMSSLAIFVLSSWSPIIIESLQFPRRTAALVASISSALAACAALALMRFTDRLGPGAIAVCSAAAVPVLLLVGFGVVPHDAFLYITVSGAILMSAMHFGMHSIAGIYYPSAIRASGGGLATSVAKLGAILGPIIAGTVLSSGMPVVRIYALLAVCPAVVSVCVLGIAAAVRAGDPSAATANEPTRVASEV